LMERVQAVAPAIFLLTLYLTLFAKKAYGRRFSQTPLIFLLFD